MSWRHQRDRIQEAASKRASKRLSCYQKTASKPLCHQWHHQGNSTPKMKMHHRGASAFKVQQGKPFSQRIQKWTSTSLGYCTIQQQICFIQTDIQIFRELTA